MSNFFSRLSIVGAIIASSLVAQTTYAALDTPVSCSSDAHFPTSCNQCFVAEPLYHGSSKINIKDLWYASPYGDEVFLNENKTPVTIDWFYTNDGVIQSNMGRGGIDFEYLAPLFSDPTYGLYKKFEPNSRNTVVHTKTGKYIKFANITPQLRKNKRTKPLYLMKFDFQYWNKSNKYAKAFSHRECTIAYPKFCGDGVVDTANGEKCDDGDNNGKVGKCNTTCTATTTPTPKPGICGPDNGKTLSSNPTNLCTAGTASNVSLSNNTYTWTCVGTDGGANASCSAKRKVDAVCGPDNGATMTTKPTRLCTVGTPTAITGEWSWGCTGINGGADVSCGAKKPTTPPPVKCDQYFTGTLRVGGSYNFPDYYINPNSFPHTLNSFTVEFKESDDMNEDGKVSGGYNFIWSNNVGPGYVVPANTRYPGIKIVEAAPRYFLTKAPSVRKDDNIFIKYTINVTGNGKTVSHSECINYVVNWCGDGIVDTETNPATGKPYETCDPKAPGQSADTCDPVTCQPKEKPKTLSIKKYVKTIDTKGDSQDTPVTVAHGETFNYYYQFENTHGTAINNVKLEDTFPAYLSHTGNIIVKDAAGNVVTSDWTITRDKKVFSKTGKEHIYLIMKKKTPLPANSGKYTVTVPVQISNTAPNNTSLQNMVYICGDGLTDNPKDAEGNDICETDTPPTPPDEDQCTPENNPKKDPACIEVGPKTFDLAIKKYIDTEDAQTAIRRNAGNTFDYVLRVQNVTSITATGTTTVRDILPAGVELNGTASGTNWTVTYTTGSRLVEAVTTQQVGSGAYFTDIRVPVRVTAGSSTTVRNDATVHNPNEAKGCYDDNRMPTGDENSCAKDSNNTDPAIFVTDGGGTPTNTYYKPNCINDIWSCQTISSNTKPDGAFATLALCKSSFTGGKVYGEACTGGPGGPGGGGGKCEDGVLQPGEECDVIGASWCKDCKIQGLTHPGANPLLSMWIKIPTFGNTKNFAADTYTLALGKTPTSYRVVVGKGSRIFTVADNIVLGMKTLYKAPIMLRSDKRFCLTAQGNAFQSTNSACTSVKDMAGGLSNLTLINGSRYLLIGKGDYQVRKSDGTYEARAIGSDAKDEITLFRGSKLYSKIGSPGKTTIHHTFVAGNQETDGSISLIGCAEGQDCTDPSSHINMARIPIKVTRAVVSSIGSVSNRKLSQYIPSASSAFTSFLGNTNFVTTTTTNNITPTPSTPVVTRPIQPMKPINGGRRGSLAADYAYNITDVAAVNGNKNILAIKDGDLTICSPVKNHTFRMKGVRTVIVENGDLVINCNIAYESNDTTSSWAWIVKNGNIIIDENVTNIAGVFVAVQDTSINKGKIKAKNNKTTQNILTIDGSLYGDAKPLFSARLYARATGAYDILTTGTVIRYSNRALVNPPPLLSQYLGNYQVQRVVK